jgi:hypothetical protein
MVIFPYMQSAAIYQSSQYQYTKLFDDLYTFRAAKMIVVANKMCDNNV